MNVASAPLVIDHKVADNKSKLAAVKKFLAFYYGDTAQQLLVDNGQPPVTDYQPRSTPPSRASSSPRSTSPRTRT